MDWKDSIPAPSTENSTPVWQESIPEAPSVSASRHRAVVENSTPDQVSRVRALQEKTGFPAHVIMDNLQAAETRAEYDQIKEATRDRLATRAFLSGPQGMALMRDKSKELANTEANLISAFTEDGSFGQEWIYEPVSAVLKQAGKAVPRTAETAYQALAGAAGLIDATEGGIGKILETGHTGAFGAVRDWALSQAQNINENITQADVLQPSDDIKGTRLWGNWDLLKDPEWLTYNVGEVATSIVPQLLAATWAGNSLSGAVVGSAQEAGTLYQDLIEDEVDPNTALAASQVFGVGVGILNKIGLEAILGKGVAKDFVSRSVKALAKGGTEGFTEWLEEPLEAIVGGVAKGKTAVEIVNDAIDAGKNVEVVVGSLIFGGGVSYYNQSIEKRSVDLKKLTARVRTAQDKQARSQLEQNVLHQLRHDLAESEIATRSPRAAEDFVRGVIQQREGLPKEVFIPADVLSEALEENPAESTAFLQGVNLTKQEVLESVADGTEVVVDMPKYAAHGFQTGIDEALQAHLKMSPDTLTANQMQDAAKDVQRQMEETLEILNKERETQSIIEQERQQIFEDVLAKRKAAGVMAKTAHADAAMFAANMAALAQRYGNGNGSPLAMYESVGLKVQGNEGKVRFAAAEKDSGAGSNIEDVQRAIANLDRFSVNAGKTVVVQSEADLPAHVLNEFAAQGGGKVHAAYSEKDQTTYFVADSIPDSKSAIGIWMHEQGVHHGLRGLLGTAELKQLLADVHQSAGDSAKYKIIADQYDLNLNKPEDQQTAAEEYLAHIAQRISEGEALGQQEKSVWEKVVAAVRAWLNQNGYSDDAVLSYEEVEQIVADAVRWTVHGDQGRGLNQADIPGAEYGRRVMDAASKWAGVVEKSFTAFRDKGHMRGVLQMGQTPDLLVELGVPDLPLTMRPLTFGKITGLKPDPKSGHSHDLTEQQVKDLYRELADPVAVIKKSDSKFEVFVDMLESGKPIMAVLDIDVEGERVAVNSLATAFGKERWVTKIVGAAHGGSLEYVDTKRLNALEDKADNLKKPGEPASVRVLKARSGKKIRFPGDVVKPMYQESNASVALNMPGVENIIKLFESTNESSFLHESGHIFFELLGHLANQPNPHPQAVADFQVALDYVGSTDGRLTEKQHEKLARTLEAYFLDGKAPSLSLRKVFSQFSNWLKNIYRNLAGISQAAGQEINPTPEITALMDRMFATDAEIMEAQEYYGGKGAQEALAADLSEEMQQQYLHAVQAAENEAIARRMERKARAVNRVGQLKRKLFEKINAELKQEPVYQAMDRIRGDVGKLDLGTLDYMVGEETRKKLSRKMLVKNGGVDPTIAAVSVGYANLDEMIADFVSVESRTRKAKRLAEEEVARRLQRIDEFFDSQGQPKAAADVHNDHALELLFLELEMTRKQANPNRVQSSLKSITNTAKRQAVQEAARKKLSTMPVREARRYDKFSRAEAKASREFQSGLKKGDHAAAEQAKLRQIMNHALVMESVKAREEIKSFQDKLKRVGKQKSMLTESRELITDIAIQFGFNGVPQARVGEYFAQYRRSLEAQKQEAPSLLQWADAMGEQGLTVYVAEWIERQPAESFQSLTFDQFRDVGDTIHSIIIADRAQRVVITDEKKRTREQLIEDLEAVASENASLKRQPDLVAGTLAQKKGKVRGFISSTHAWHMKMENVLIDLDGGEPGLFWETFFLPMEDAANDEMKRLKIANEELSEIFKVFDSKQRVKMSTQKVFVDAVGKSLTRWHMIMAALNSGNEGNKKRLMEGENWTSDQLQAVIDMLSKEEMDFVASVWKYFESFRDESFALEKELTGRTPHAVEPSPVRTPHGVYQGGYFPIAYDPKRGHKAAHGQENDQLTKGGSLKNTHHARAVTRKGHLKEREQGTGEALRLEPEVIADHVFQVIHDLSHRKAVQGVAQLANDPRIMRILKNYAGFEVAGQLLPWVQDIAAEQNGPQSPIHKAARWARTGTTLMAMGFKATTGLTQVVGYTQSIHQLKGWDKKYAATGLATVYRNPRRLPQLLRETYAKSSFMEGRMKSFDRDIREASKKLTGGDAIKNRVNEFAFTHIGVMQMGVDLPTWWAMYAKQMDEHGNEQKAIQAADSFVRQTQGGGATKDLARIQRGSDLMKTTTMFYSFFNTLYNLFYLSGRHITKQETTTGKISATAGMVTWLWILPSLLSELIAGRGPDDEDWDEWALPILGLYPSQSIVGLRDVANALGTKYGYAVTPAQAPVESLIRWSRSINRAIEEKDATLLIRPTVDTVGYLAHIPLGQAMITGENLIDYITGQDHEFQLRDLLFRKPQSRR